MLNQPDTNLFYPAFALPAPYRSEAMEALRAISKPLATARDGDIVGLVHEAHLIRGSLFDKTPDSLIRKTRDSFETVPFLSLSRDAQDRLAPALYRFGLFGMENRRKVVSHVADMSAGDGEVFYTDHLVFPTFSILRYQNYEEDFLQDLDPDDIENSEIARCTRVITPIVESAHERLQIEGLLHEITRLVNALCPIPSDDREDLPVLLQADSL